MPDDTNKELDSKKFDDVFGYGRTINSPAKYALLNKLITRDLNKRTLRPSFYRYTKDDISGFIADPYTNQKQLRDAVIYIYGASPHFRRLIQYFSSLTDWSYVVSPYRIDPAKANKATINRNYRRVLNTMSIMNVRTQFPRILTKCLREDCCYCTMWVTSDNITIQILPSDYCSITSVEGNVPNVTFDFTYFNQREQELNFFPDEFRTKYNLYKSDTINRRYQELDSPMSFAIKCNNDILEYSIPPFAGILREVYDLEDYKNLKLSKTAIENYAMLVMTIGVDDDGHWKIDLDKAREFWQNLDSVIPDEIGSILTPMPVDKISFEKSNTGDVDTIADAEQNLFTAAGVSSLLFNNSKASANALSLSIKVDQSMTYGIVKSIEDAVNRYIQSQGYGKYFKVTFLDVSPFNRKEAGDMYLKACQYGIPMVSYFCASQGLSQSELDCMNFLENEVIDIKNTFIPLRNSTNSPTEETNVEDDEDGDPGRPPVEDGDLTDSGEQSREDSSDWG